MTSRISTLCRVRYIQVTKTLGHHLSGRWSLYREKFDLKSKGRTTTWSLRTGGRFKKVVVKTGLTAIRFLEYDTSFQIFHQGFKVEMKSKKNAGNNKNW